MTDTGIAGSGRLLLRRGIESIGASRDGGEPSDRDQNLLRTGGCPSTQPTPDTCTMFGPRLVLLVMVAVVLKLAVNAAPFTCASWCLVAA